MTARLTITDVQIGDVTILRMSGRLELEEGDLAFRDYVERLVAGGHLKILLDLKAVTRIDSAGIGMLVSKYLSAQNRGGATKLLHLTHRSDHLMDITRLATVFEIFEDDDDAVRSFGSGTPQHNS